MSKPAITTHHSKSGKTYRVTLSSLSTIGRKRSFFLIEELRRGDKINMSYFDLGRFNEKRALAAFHHHVKHRDEIESRVLQLFPDKWN